MSREDRVRELKPDTLNERRAFQRSGCRIAVKLRQCANAIYTSGRTLDVSMSGAGIEVVGPRPVNEGDRIAIAFENLRCPVTRATRMVGAEIVRVEPKRDGCQRIGVRFDALQLGLEGLELRSAA